MPFNLLTDPWVEVRRASGACDCVRPCHITGDDDPVMALDFPRPDWNAAVTEFLIGLTFLALPCDDVDEWEAHFVIPPAPDELQKAWQPLVPCFNLDGEGPLAFQDFDDLAAQDIKPVSSLLIDAPGENALRNNSDLFVKRDGVTALSLPLAAAALITLQTYAPSGGAGHRTSMRGGGPLTTLVTPRRSGQKVTNLWDRIWANVPYRDEDFSLNPRDLFPWMRPTVTSAKNEIVTPEDRPLALAFFACPRRLRLVFSKGQCSLSGAEGAVAAGFRTQNYGANYQSWLHPLSPYYEDKKSGKLPRHPHAGAADYGDWLAWWGFDGYPATVVGLWDQRRSTVRAYLDPLSPDGIEAFGFDMDNMKARHWLNARASWLPEGSAALKASVKAFIDATDETARAANYACRTALYGQKKADGHYRVEGADSFKAPGEQVWAVTQALFEGQLTHLIARAGAEDGDTDLREAWIRTLRREAFRVFEAFVDVDGLTDEDPRRLLYARNQLNSLITSKARTALGLAKPVKSGNKTEETV